MRYFKKLTRLLCLVISCVLISGCGAYFSQPLDTQNARIGETTDATYTLRNLPPPIAPAVVGVYRFEDQTGQFKQTENGSTFSNAVTQGGTTILIKALEDSNWFTIIERENLDNLLNERNIISATRKDYSQQTNTQQPPLPSLLYAGVIIEGGIVSYDTNVLTGGVGARYFGAGGSSKYRQDRVTVYLRAVLTQTGQVMKTVYVSKSIYSQAVDASLFRYVNFKRLLEAETGFTRNEPAQLAVTEAIEKAVEALIVEGIDVGLWYPKGGQNVADQMQQNYRSEKEVAERTDVYQRELLDRRSKWRIDAGGGATYANNDLPNPYYEYSLLAGVKYNFTPFLGLYGQGSGYRIKNTGTLNRQFASTDLNLEFTVLPYEKFTPMIYAGPGLNYGDGFNVIDFKAQAGLSFEYLVSPSIGIKVYGDYNVVFSDEMDRIVSGVRDDQYYKFGAGINVYLGKSQAKENSPSYLKRQQKKELKRVNELQLKNDMVIDSLSRKQTNSNNQL
ncbi:CsgG/HfaB family protein [Nonlabens marinus]|uniref:Curli production assembly/transport component CsgG n=1 Tax=Nonlabens marinus S1-08 TaxID=1454201 RepID=W8VQX4_9FLAO|nr:CsgG/HfaB family protein [Nonlabens marinus]BAO55954.1 curli production assembly/transport component CsgG [Nonlabens marinus S1-08]